MRANRKIKETEDTEEEVAGMGGKTVEVPWRIYAAHTLSTWGDNAWWFAGGCYMLELQRDSLRLTATYGLVIAASVLLAGATVGRWIDRSRRLTAARAFLAAQNTAVSLCALLLAAFLTYRDHVPAELQGWAVTAVSVAAILLASLARLASTGTNIIIQKDWVVVIAAGDADRLARMNSILRTIELTTYMLAPAAVGQLFTFAGLGLTGVVLAGWNVASVCVEYLLLSLIYTKYPALASKASPAGQEEEGGQERGELAGALAGWRTYFTHPVRNAGLGLACLYMTVLGFDNITYGFCLLQGVPHAVLGILVAGSALVGVAGSLAFPLLRSRLGIERTGLVGMFLLISCSSLAVVSAFLPGSPMDLHLTVNSTANTTEVSEEATYGFWQDYASVSTLLFGIITARFGLWVVDLTVTQLLQEKVAEGERGVVNGVQDSLNNSLDLLKCVMVILLPHPRTFALLIFASFASINLGWLLYALYSRSQRGHLFHFSRLAPCLPSTPSTPDMQTKQIGGERGSSEETARMVQDMEERLEPV